MGRHHNVGIPSGMLEIIKQIVTETQLYHNPSEFVISATREKIEVYQKAILDQKKVDIYYSRKEQVKTESRPSNVSSVPNHSQPS